MPKRKRGTLLTYSKTKKKKKIDAADEEIKQVEEEWDVLNAANAFTLAVDDSEDFQFSLHDHIYVAHDKSNLEDTQDDNYWVAEILEIRERPDNDDSVWLKVQWFYRHSDLTGKAKSFNKNGWGEYELIYSNHNGFIESTSISGPMSVTYYDESEIDHLPIAEDEYYYRYEFSIKDKSFSLEQIEPSCCASPYNPDKDVMRICPRDHKTFHQSCLEKYDGSQEAIDHLRELSLPSLTKKKPGSRKRVHFNSRQAPSSDYSEIPKQLLSYARLPVLKGKVYGVAGNGHRVIKARQFIREALDPKKRVPIPDDWEEQLGGKKAAGRLPDAAVAYKCPQCGDPI